MTENVWKGVGNARAEDRLPRGGSPYNPASIYAIVENREVFAGSEVCLMDIDPARLPLLVQLGKVLAKRADADITFTSTTDPREALDGATFVFPGYRVGGVKHMNYDFVIPDEHGIVGDETAAWRHLHGPVHHPGHRWVLQDR